jgi:hypothetical protein
MSRNVPEDKEIARRNLRMPGADWPPEWRRRRADCYRKVIEFVRQHPKEYDPDFEKPFQGWVEELDPPAAT